MRGFGELESAIMDVMWSRDEPAKVRDVLEALEGERDSAYTTVMTVMNILHRKGWLDRERSGRAWQYRPTMTREAYAAQLMREALHDGADTDAVLARFVTESTPEEAETLRAALRRLSRKPKR